MNTNNFKKRFDILSLKEKIPVAEMVGKIVQQQQMPTGKKLSDAELMHITELADWCNENIFFNRKPNGEYADEPFKKLK